MNEYEIHGPGGSGSDYVLCGLGEDAFETGDHHEPIVIAQPGEVVTCETCRQVIDHVRAVFRGFRVKRGA